MLVPAVFFSLLHIIQVMQDNSVAIHKEMDAIDSKLLSHLQDEAAKLRKEKVKRQQKFLLETTCAMKSLKYAVSALQKECSNAFVPECGGLISYNTRGRKPTNRETQTQDMDSPGDSEEMLGPGDKMFVDRGSERLSPNQ